MEERATTGPLEGSASLTGTGAGRGVRVVLSRKKQREAPESNHICPARDLGVVTKLSTPSVVECAAASALIAELLDFAAACRLDYATALVAESPSASPPSVGLHEEIWLRQPPGFTRSFPTGTQWSLRRPVYGLCQTPREWHDMLRTTLAALGFAPSTADPSLFLRTDTSLPPFYVLVNLSLQITQDRAQRTITLTQSHMVHQVLQRFGFQFSSPQPTPLSTSHSLSTPPSDESVEPSGLYPELLGCLMYLMTCTRPDLAYPVSLLARYVAPGRHQKVHWDAAKRVLRYLCSTSGMWLVLGGWGPLRWLTYLLTDLGEQPRSPPVLYVDNKAMIALCQEHRLEHRTKHITLQYFLARELQQRGHLRLAYVASQANTVDVFTKALPPGDHQRFVTVQGLIQ
ncbi:unnamed protein product [Closterium sp. NIES-54]